MNATTAALLILAALTLAAQLLAVSDHEAQRRELRRAAQARQRCYCGWHKLGECPHCPAGKTCADKLRDRGSAIPSSVCQCNDDIRDRST